MDVGDVASFTTSRINCVVGLVVSIFCFEYTVVSLGVIIPWLSVSVPGVLNLCAVTTTTCMGLYCYLLCVLSDPGKVPDSYQHDPEDQVALQVQVKRKGGAARWCSKCSKPKPPRAHHCRVCERCVKRMDHHCPYINNCVGHGNYKAFVLCLFYTELALVHAMALFCAHALHMLSAKSAARVVRIGPEGLPANLGQMTAFDEGTQHFVLWAVLQTIGLALTLPLSIGVGVLLGWHVYILLSNKTTIEYHEGVTASAHFKTFGQRFEHPYNVGTLNNVMAVLGSNVVTWFVPGIAAAGDGLVYPTNVAECTVLTKTQSAIV